MVGSIFNIYILIYDPHNNSIVFSSDDIILLNWVIFRIRKHKLFWKIWFCLYLICEKYFIYYLYLGQLNQVAIARVSVILFI